MYALTYLCLLCCWLSGVHPLESCYAEKSVNQTDSFPVTYSLSDILQSSMDSKMRECVAELWMLWFPCLVVDTTMCTSGLKITCTRSTVHFVLLHVHWEPWVSHWQCGLVNLCLRLSRWWCVIRLTQWGLYCISRIIVSKGWMSNYNSYAPA